MNIVCDSYVDGSDYRPEAGWAWPLTAKKAHYFDKEARALCRRWLFFGKLEEGNDESPDNCLECRKRLARLRASKNETPQCQ